MKTATHTRSTSFDREASPARVEPRPVASSPRARLAIRDADWSEARQLLREYADWVRDATGVDLFEQQPTFTSEVLDPARSYRLPQGILLVAEERGSICGIVGLRLHSDDSAELKHLYVRPDARGAGHADRLLGHAFEQARRLGATRMWLDTLPGPMDAAIRLYHRHGFRATDARPTVDVAGAIAMERSIR